MSNLTPEELEAFFAQRALDLAVVRGERSRSRPLFDERIWKDAHGNLLTLREGREWYVMPVFERPLMEASAQILCRSHGAVLNVGFGLGLIDQAIQRHGVESHVIVEAHRTVLEWMRRDGWAEKPNVEILASRWEDIDWSKHQKRFDGVFFDPYPYAGRSLHEVWATVVRMIVKPGGVAVVYGPQLAEEGARDMARVLGATIERQTCRVDVPFLVPEWSVQGVGSHDVTIYALRISG